MTTFFTDVRGARLAIQMLNLAANPFLLAAVRSGEDPKEPRFDRSKYETITATEPTTNSVFSVQVIADNGRALIDGVVKRFNDTSPTPTTPIEVEKIYAHLSKIRWKDGGEISESQKRLLLYNMAANVSRNHLDRINDHYTALYGIIINHDIDVGEVMSKYTDLISRTNAYKMRLCRVANQYLAMFSFFEDDLRVNGDEIHEEFLLLMDFAHQASVPIDSAVFAYETIRATTPEKSIESGAHRVATVFVMQVASRTGSEINSVLNILTRAIAELGFEGALECLEELMKLSIESGTSLDGQLIEIKPKATKQQSHP